MDDQKLPPYNKMARCPKCDFGYITTEYCPGPPKGGSWPTCKHCQDDIYDGEHLERECPNCRYKWLEAPLDRKEEPRMEEKPA